jgi:serine phosphatase RsbU (regulator of sigma subunit)
MRFFLTLTLSILLNSTVFGQVENVDSLNSILDTISNTERKIKFCMEQGDVYENRDLDAFEYWYFKGIEIGKGSEVQYMLPMLYAYLGYEYNSRGDYEKQAEFIHEGKKYVDEDGPFKYRRTILSAEAGYYLGVDQFDKAIEINTAIISMAKEEKDSIVWSATLHNLGICYYKINEIDKADSLIKEALVINEIIGQELYAVNNLSMLANIEGRRKNYQQALTYNLQAQDKYIELDDVSGMTVIASNIAGNYWELGNKKEAFNNLDKAIEMAKEYELNRWLWISYLKYSQFYEDDRNYKKALEYFKLYTDTKTESINEQSATKLESLQSELKEQKLAVLEKNEALQAEQIKLQEEKILSQKHEKAKDRILKYFLIGGLLLVGLFGLFVYNRLKLTRKQNKIIEEQNEKVQLAYEEIAEKNMDITASITYAQRIQNAILPDQSEISKHLSDHFILYKPKDLVSGDFYWFEEANGCIFFAAADCTGHGVPGAIVSVICHNALNRAVKEFKLTKAGEILDKTRELVIEQIAKSQDNVKDGMDIALCVIDKKNKSINFAGANNPLWIIRGEELIATKGDKQPVGSHHDAKPFTTHEVECKPNDRFYLFSDGYGDQFGGEKGKKFKTKSLAELLFKLKSLPLNKQGEKLAEEFENWKGDFEQLDDVCVLGFMV